MVVHPAAGNWSGTLLNALARARSGERRAAARRHRPSARQGHLGADGRRPHARRGDRADAGDRGARGAASLPRDRARVAGARALDASRRRSAAIRSCARGWRSSRRASRHEPTSSASPPRRGSPPCAARCTAVARTRSASISRAPACRWSAIACTAERRRSAWSARRCTPNELAFVHPRSGEPMAFESAPPRDFAHAWDTSSRPRAI